MTGLGFFLYNRGMKHWVMILLESGKVEVWPDYGHVAWGSPEYTVLGFVSGSRREAMAEARRRATVL